MLHRILITTQEITNNIVVISIVYTAYSVYGSALFKSMTDSSMILVTVLKRDNCNAKSNVIIYTYCMHFTIREMHA